MPPTLVGSPSCCKVIMKEPGVWNVYDFTNQDNPHFALSPVGGERCSDILVNISASKNMRSMRVLANELANKLMGWVKESAFKDDKLSIVSSAYGGIILGSMVAEALDVPFCYTEKGPNGEQVWTGRFSPPDPQRAMVRVEDVYTTGATARAVREAILKVSPETQFLPVVAAAVDRTAGSSVDIISAVQLVGALVVPRAECPMCAAGSPRISPKGKR